MKKLTLILTSLVLAFTLQGQSFKNKTYPYGNMPEGRDAGIAMEVYKKWKSEYLESCSNGRYRVKFQSPNETVSEGIAYGMLLTSYANEQNIFDGLWKYYVDNCTQSGVMNWKMEGCTKTVLGQNGATDAELDASLALITAHKLWGSNGEINYEEAAKKLIGIIKEREVEKNTYLLKPGDAFGGSNITNISYFAPAYYKVFGQFTNDEGFWGKVYDKAYEVIDANLKVNSAVGGLVSDWCKGDGTHSDEAHGYQNSGKWYWHDASRTPWRITTDYVWFGSSKAKGFTDKCKSFVDGIGGISNVKSGYRQDGTVEGKWHNAVYTGPFAIAAMATSQSYANTAYNDFENITPYGYFDVSLKALYMFMLTGNFYNPLEDGGVIIDPKDINVDPTEATLKPQETKQLVATVLPSNATNKNVTWSSSNTSIATVSKSGLVTANAEGEATITATTEVGGFKAVCKITVKDDGTVLINVTGVSLNKTALTLEINQNVTLSETVAPNNATDKSVTWKSSNPAIAKVNNGVVTALTEGTAIITVTTNDGGFEATCEVTVKSGGNTGCDLGIPGAPALENIDTQWENIYIEGNGPDMSNIKRFSINWSKTYSGLYVLAVNTNNGNPSWYVDLKAGQTNTFASANPTITFSGTGIPAFDGEFYVNLKDGNFIMKKVDGSFTLIFSNETTSPCENAVAVKRTSATQQTEQNELSVYPNPVSDKLFIDRSTNEPAQLQVLTMEGKQIERLTIDQKLVELETSEYRPGLYMINIKTNTSSQTTKFMVK